jgi:hypothetical protein
MFILPSMPTFEQEAFASINWYPMDNHRPHKTTPEELMLRNMRISILGRDTQSRCGPISEGQQKQMEEAAIERIMESMGMDREAARAFYRKMTEGA